MYQTDQFAKWMILLESCRPKGPRFVVPPLGSIAPITPRPWVRRSRGIACCLPRENRKFPAPAKKFPAPVHREFVHKLLKSKAVSVRFFAKSAKHAQISPLAGNFPCSCAVGRDPYSPIDRRSATATASVIARQ